MKTLLNRLRERWLLVLVGGVCLLGGARLAFGGPLSVESGGYLYVPKLKVTAPQGTATSECLIQGGSGTSGVCLGGRPGTGYGALYLGISPADRTTGNYTLASDGVTMYIHNGSYLMQASRLEGPSFIATAASGVVGTSLNAGARAVFNSDGNSAAYIDYDPTNIRIRMPNTALLVGTEITTSGTGANLFAGLIDVGVIEADNYRDRIGNDRFVTNGSSNVSNSYFGRITDAVGATAHKVGNSATLTNTWDRYIADFFLDNLATSRLKITTNGGIIFGGVATSNFSTGVTGLIDYNSQIRAFRQYRGAFDSTGSAGWKDVGGGLHPVTEHRTHIFGPTVAIEGTVLSALTSGTPALTQTNAAAATADSATETYRSYVKLNTAAAAASISSANTTAITTRNYGARFSTHIATYESTSMRLWLGLTMAAIGSLDEQAANNYCMFRYSTAAGDTSWQACSADGTTASCTSTGNAVNVRGELLEIDMRHSTVCAFYIDGVLVASKSTNLPTAAQSLVMQMSIEALAASTRSLGISVASVESN